MMTPEQERQALEEIHLHLDAACDVLRNLQDKHTIFDHPATLLETRAKLFALRRRVVVHAARTNVKEKAA